MAEKPRKLTYQYACWRGTPDHLIEIATTLKDEIERASQATQKRALADINESFQRQREEFRLRLRTQAGLSKEAPLTPELLAAMAQADAAAVPIQESQKREQEKQIATRWTKVSFTYTDNQGQSKSSDKPEFLKTATKTNGVNLRGSVFWPEANASAAIMIQNRPWETVSLEVEGEDADWVSSSAAPLHSLLLNRESKVVKFLRSSWLRSVIGISLWVIFIPTIDDLLRRFSINQLISVPVAVVPAGLLGLLFQSLTKPFVITSKEPNALMEIGKAAIPPVFGALASFALGRLFR